MVQGYYTLEEAARILGMTTDKLSQMAQKREIRAFADRGTWRFRTQDIEEMARRLGRGSSPELQLGEAPKAQASKPATPKPSAGDPGIFDFKIDDGDQVELGQVLHVDSTGSRSGSRSGRSPKPQAGSDSDVKLVPDESDVDFKIHVEDSGVKVQRTPGRMTPPSKKGDSSKPASSKPGSSKPGSSKRSGNTPVVDSGVRLVPMDDPAIRPSKSPSDSDIRIDAPMTTNPGGEAMLTDEIDLDAELRKAEEAARARKGQTPGKKATVRKPPIEDVTEHDLEVPQAKKQATPRPAQRADEDDAVVLGDLGAVDLAESSGINLHNPDDSGINLEKTSSAQDKSEFELSSDVPSTPKPAGAPPTEDSSSEFELSLDVEATPKPAPVVPEDDSSSEFELSLDVEATPKPVAAAPQADSSSEFELTLDDSGQLAPIEDSSSEVIETDFEVPALDEEGGDAAERSDTALESSDFDLSLNEEDSSSQVVAIDDEDADEEAATVARAAVAEDEPAEVDELLDDDLVAAPEEEGETVAAVSAAPAPWGVLPAVVLSFSVLVMFVVTLMSFELMHNLWGYHQAYRPTAVVTEGLATKLFNLTLPTDKGGKR